MRRFLLWLLPFWLCSGWRWYRRLAGGHWEQWDFLLGGHFWHHCPDGCLDAEGKTKREPTWPGLSVYVGPCEQHGPPQPRPMATYRSEGA